MTAQQRFDWWIFRIGGVCIVILLGGLPLWVILAATSLSEAAMRTCP
jgi:hypothetical protein